jgi:ParB family chromosome partitioning protein
MNKQKPQLGKGMAALLGSDITKMLNENKSTELNNKNLETSPLLVDVSMLVANKAQPRKIFKDKELHELSESIKENGIIQPILVSELDGKFEIIAGERRYRAAKLAGLTKIPVLVKRATKKDSMVMAIIENVQRSDLNCVEEALAYYQLMSEFNLTQEEVAKKLGKDRSTVANYLRMLKLPKDVIMLLQKELLTFGHAKVLAVLTVDEEIKRIANEVVLKKLSVRELEDLIKVSGKKKKIKLDTKFIDQKYNSLKNKLEQKTGYHFEVKSKKNGAGSITIKFSNEAEFDSIYGYLLK